MDRQFRIGCRERLVMDLQTQELCKSIFKNGRTETTTQNFTHKLTELINQIEKAKQILTEK